MGWTPFYVGYDNYGGGVTVLCSLRVCVCDFCSAVMLL